MDKTKFTTEAQRNRKHEECTVIGKPIFVDAVTSNYATQQCGYTVTEKSKIEKKAKLEIYVGADFGEYHPSFV